MRNTMIALSGNNAIVMAEKSYKSGQYKLISANNSTMAALMALEFSLNKASDNDTIDKEILTIYVPDIIKGFAMSTYKEYIRTGKTSGGRAYSEEELDLVKRCAMLMCTKGLNIKVIESKYMSKDLKPFKDKVLNTAKELKENAPAQTAAPVQQVAVNPNQKLIDKLHEKMIQAADDCDFELYDKLNERLQQLTNVAPQVQNAPAQNAPQKPETEEPEEEEVVEENEVEVDSDVAEMDC